MSNIQNNKKNEEIFTILKTTRNLAYVPYSNFGVAACILADNNKYYTGCNVENAAYPLGCCAEASAISSMVLDSAKKIKEISVLGSGNMLCTPCGGCRQRIREFATDNCIIHLYTDEGYKQSISLAELLPLSFGPANLK